MTFKMYVILIFLTFLWEASGIWPPPYEIKLDDAETFVISELSESDDLFNDEDEMIRAKPPSADQKKYSRIHQIALRHNKKEWNRNRAEPENNVKIKEHNFDMENAVPWEGGFVDKNGDFIQPDNENVYYLNEMAKSLIESKIERKREEEEDQSTDKIENYDYKNFRAEYKAEIETEKKQKNTLNFTDVKEDESLEEAVEKVVEFTEAKNCTAEEKKGIGMAAMKCIVKDLQTAKSKNSILNLFEKILRITLIWFCVYAIIAIPCWCQRGWCCCCCCCKICRPRQSIDEAKTFFMQNPPGIFHTEDGEKVEYQPTNYEIYAQKRLEKALFNL